MSELTSVTIPVIYIWLLIQVWHIRWAGTAFTGWKKNRLYFYVLVNEYQRIRQRKPAKKLRKLSQNEAVVPALRFALVNFNFLLLELRLLWPLIASWRTLQESPFQTRSSCRTISLDENVLIRSTAVRYIAVSLKGKVFVALVTDLMRKLCLRIELLSLNSYPLPVLQMSCLFAWRAFRLQIQWRLISLQMFDLYRLWWLCIV